VTASEQRRLLGGRTPDAFLEQYWQKEALLVRSAIPDIARVLTRDDLFALAARDDVQSRCVERCRGRYHAAEGPFTASMLRRMPPRNWTLLVHGVNLFCAAADALMRRFAFMPYARLDDVMVSYAAPGGGVGPHFDSYDVFLVQGVGRRRWRYGRQDDLALRPRAPLKLLKRFEPAHDATLAPTDMLYVPPDYPHDGVALDACMTYSIGFRAPLHQELVEAFVDHLRDTLNVCGRYADPDLRATAEPARIDRRMQRRLRRSLADVRFTHDDIARFIGRHLTEPKANVAFTRRRRGSPGAFLRQIAAKGVRLDPRTQLLYDDARCYVNGDDAPLPGDSLTLRALADRRALDAADCRGLDAETLRLLYDWYRNGYLTPA